MDFQQIFLFAADLNLHDDEENQSISGYKSCGPNEPNTKIHDEQAEISRISCPTKNSVGDK
jgi:hypothetical protein